MMERVVIIRVQIMELAVGVGLVKLEALIKRLLPLREVLEVMVLLNLFLVPLSSTPEAEVVEPMQVELLVQEEMAEAELGPLPIVPVHRGPQIAAEVLGVLVLTLQVRVL